MPIPKNKARSLMKLLLDGRVREAESFLSDLKSRLNPKSEWDRGYLKALEGMVLGLKKNSGSAYVKEILGCKNPRDELAYFEKTFFEKPVFLRDEFQDGFFTCWLEMLKLAVRSLKA